MRFLRGLLLATSGSGSSNGSIDGESLGKIANEALESFENIINIVLPIILGAVLLVGTIYAIILGVNYSKAEDAEARKKARDRLVGAVVGFLIALALIAVIYGLLSAGFTKTLFFGNAK